MGLVRNISLSLSPYTHTHTHTERGGHYLNFSTTLITMPNTELLLLLCCLCALNIRARNRKMCIMTHAHTHIHTQTHWNHVWLLSKKGVKLYFPLRDFLHAILQRIAFKGVPPHSQQWGSQTICYVKMCSWEVQLLFSWKSCHQGGKGGFHISMLQGRGLTLFPLCHFPVENYIIPYIDICSQSLYCCFGQMATKDAFFGGKMVPDNAHTTIQIC